MKTTNENMTNEYHMDRSIVRAFLENLVASLESENVCIEEMIRYRQSPDAMVERAAHNVETFAVAHGLCAEPADKVLALSMTFALSESEP